MRNLHVCNAKYLFLIDASSGYHNLKLDERSSYLMTFTCLFGRYRYKRLPFGAALAGDMFQRKTDEIFKELPNVFSIANYMLAVRYKPMAKTMMKHYEEYYIFADR